MFLGLVGILPSAFVCFQLLGPIDSFFGLCRAGTSFLPRGIFTLDFLGYVA